MDRLLEIRDQLKLCFESARVSSKAVAYYQLGALFEQMNDVLREYSQEKTKGELEMVLKNLKSGKDITAEELKLIKVWISGPADSYVRMENNFEDWIKDLHRVIQMVGEMGEKPLNVEQALRLSGLVQDGRRTSVDVLNYLEKKEQVQTFEAAVHSLDDAQKRAHLVMLLTAKLNSRDY